MPSALVKSLAAKAGISVARAERLWDRAKELAKREFPETSKRFYPYTVGILKKMLKLEGYESSGNRSRRLREASIETRVVRLLKIYDYGRSLSVERLMMRAGISYKKYKGMSNVFMVYTDDYNWRRLVRWLHANGVDFESRYYDYWSYEG